MRYVFRKRVSNFDVRRELVVRTRLTRARVTSLVSFVTRRILLPRECEWERERDETPRGNIVGRMYVYVCVRA